VSKFEKMLIPAYFEKIQADIELDFSLIKKKKIIIIFFLKKSGYSGGNMWLCGNPDLVGVAAWPPLFGRVGCAVTSFLR
jgi:hypothetical protein